MNLNDLSYIDILESLIIQINDDLADSGHHGQDAAWCDVCRVAQNVEAFIVEHELFQIGGPK